MATIVECPLITCIYNARDRGKKGQCRADRIETKWRFAADMGKGAIVCIECLQFTLEGEGNGSQSVQENNHGGS